MVTIEEQQNREEFRRWLHARAPTKAIAVTITFRRQVTVEEARSAMTKFCRMLNLKAYGSSFKTGRNRLAIIPVQEGGDGASEKRVHYHLHLEVPVGWTTEAWTAAVAEKFKKIEEFGHEHFVVKPVWDSGWLNYCLKSRDKTSFADAIDVQNLWLN